MSPRDQIRFWKKQFRVLDSWRFYFAPKSEYKGQAHVHYKKKTCTIYDLPSWNGKKGMPKDYILHEVLHVAQRAVTGHRKHKDKMEAEELFVQDICDVVRINGGLSEKRIRENW